MQHTCLVGYRLKIYATVFYPNLAGSNLQYFIETSKNANLLTLRPI